MKSAVLISHDVETGSCVIGVPDEHGGLTELPLDPPFSAPQFLPEVGEEVLLTMDGPVPRILPQQLGVDSVGLAEVRFGTVTALLLQGDQIIAGDPAGNHVVIDVAGVRLVRDGVDVTVDLQTESGDGLFTGILQTAAYGIKLRITPGEDGGSTIDFIPADDDMTKASRIWSEDDGGLQNLNFRSGGIGSDIGSMFMAPTGTDLFNNLETVVRSNTTVQLKIGSTVRIQADATGIGFYGATPVAKPAVTGSRAGNAALASLLTALASQGLITDSTTA